MLTPLFYESINVIIKIMLSDVITLDIYDNLIL